MDGKYCKFSKKNLSTKLISCIMNLGTFRLVAKPFMQMFSIHAFIRKGKELKQVPLMFVLMTSRKTKDYKKVFEKARIIH
jgi:hypothetical protein